MFNRNRKLPREFRVMSPLRYAVILIGALAFNAAIWSGIQAQVSNPGVQQSGAVTTGHCVKWGPGLGQISDNGANCATSVTPANATSANDTNVTLTLSGTPTGALLQAVQWQMGWTGTLAAGRLNSNVVQSFVNDTNVTASIAAQVATLGWSGQLAIGRGGTGAATAAAAISALMPTPTRAGDIAFWNGANWTTLAGNNSGTQVLSENATGVPSWSAAGTGTVTTLTAGTAISFSSGATCSSTCTINNTGVTSLLAGTGISVSGATGAVTVNTNLSAGAGITISGTAPQAVALSLGNTTLQATPTNPTGAASAASVMMGLGTTCKLTPTYSGRIHVGFAYNVGGFNAGQTAQMTLKFGTGTAPANGVAVTGTSVGSLKQTIGISGVGASYSVTTNRGNITGLTPGTAYWFDIAVVNGSGGTVNLTNVDCDAFEY